MADVNINNKTVLQNKGILSKTVYCAGEKKKTDTGMVTNIFGIMPKLIRI